MRLTLTVMSGTSEQHPNYPLATAPNDLHTIAVYHIFVDAVLLCTSPTRAASQHHQLWRVDVLVLEPGYIIYSIVAYKA